MPEPPWVTIESKYAYRAQTPDEISFRSDRVRFPTGREGTYVYAEYPFEVCYLLPIADDGRLLFIKQYRYPIRDELVQIPAGSPLPGETLLDCAVRETEEETGYHPVTVSHALDFYPSPGSADMIGHLFIGRGLTESSTPRDAEEPTETLLVEPEQAAAMLREGQIREVATLLSLLLLGYGR